MTDTATIPRGLRIAAAWLDQIRAATGAEPDPATIERITGACFRDRPCRDCAAPIGQPHDHGCDVENCQWTGIQWIQCGGTGGWDVTGRFDRPGVPEEWPPDPLELPAYQWSAPRGPESIYRAPETGGDPLESLARFQRMLDDLSREQRPPPHEIAASDRAALESALSALLAGIPGVEPAAPWMGEIGSLFSLPLVIDDTLPPGRVELRDRGGNVIWTLLPARPATGAEHTGGVDSGMPERFVAIDPAHGGGDTFVSGWRGPGGRLHIDRAETDPPFFADLDRRLGELARANISPPAARCRCSIPPLGEPCTAIAGDGIHDDAPGIQAVIDRAGVQAAIDRISAQAPPDPELEASRHWPAPARAVCAHVCGADAGHRCDARASTSLRFTLPSGGLRDLPLCGPCAQAESTPAGVPRASSGRKEWLKAHINRPGADEDRACPACGLPMYYAPSTGQHACQDPDCEYAHPEGG